MMRILLLPFLALPLVPGLVLEVALAQASDASLANDRNLRAMIANPEDLDRAGRSTAAGRGDAAGKAVQSLVDGKTRPLPDPRSGGSAGAKGGGHEP